MPEKVLYFAYGSNLLSKRFHIDNPIAKRAGIGKLKDYRIDFAAYCTEWEGPMANIVAKMGCQAWGALWEIDSVHVERLDRQERDYHPLEVEVETLDGNLLKCRTYQHKGTFVDVPTLDDLPEDRRPSALYLGVIVKGAEESGLPQEYITFLKNIPNNGITKDFDENLAKVLSRT